jgi:hypothetical protein
MIPGWPYSWVVALEPGRTSWTLPLDAVRLGPADDATEVTAAQLRDVVARLIAAGHWREGDPDIIVVLDAGYDLTRLAWLLDGLPVDVTGRLRSDRVMYFPAPPLPARPASTGGRRPRHGRKLAFGEPATWPDPAVTTVTDTARYGTATAMAWPRLHQRLEHRGSWEDHDGELPVVEGTLIRLAVDHLPGQRDADPVWLWSSRAGTADDEVNRTWQAFLRRFDIEHTLRFLKQQLGWTRPKLRDPAAADRWTWLVIACYAQLHLARTLAADIRMPWQQPCPPGRLTPARVRRGFRRVRQALPVPASAPKPSRPGPGRPPGSKNSRPPPATTSAKPSGEPNPRKSPARRRVKQQAKGVGISGAGKRHRRRPEWRFCAAFLRPPPEPIRASRSSSRRLFVSPAPSSPTWSASRTSSAGRALCGVSPAQLAPAGAVRWPPNTPVMVRIARSAPTRPTMIALVAAALAQPGVPLRSKTF